MRLPPCFLKMTLSTLVVFINSANSIPFLLGSLCRHKTSWKSCCSSQFRPLISDALSNPSHTLCDGMTMFFARAIVFLLQLFNSSPTRPNIKAQVSELMSYKQQTKVFLRKKRNKKRFKNSVQLLTQHSHNLRITEAIYPV